MINRLNNLFFLLTCYLFIYLSVIDKKIETQRISLKTKSLAEQKKNNLRTANRLGINWLNN